MILLPPRPTHPYTLVPYPTLFRYPVLAAHKHAGIAVLQFQVVDTLEDLRKGFPALEVQVTVVGGLGQALAAVVDADQVSVGLGRGPACAYRQRSEEHTSELQSLKRITYAVFSLNKKTHKYTE